MQSTTENAIKEANIEMETVKKSITVLSSELSAAKVELPLVNEKVEKLQDQMKEENGQDCQENSNEAWTFRFHDFFSTFVLSVVACRNVSKGMVMLVFQTIHLCHIKKVHR